MPTAVSSTPAETVGNEKSDLRRLADEFRAAIGALTPDTPLSEWVRTNDLYEAIREALIEAGSFDTLLAELRELRRQQRSGGDWTQHPRAHFLVFMIERERRWRSSTEYREEHKEDCRRWRKANRARTAEYDAQRAESPERQAQIRAARKAYRQRIRLAAEIAKEIPDDELH